MRGVSGKGAWIVVIAIIVILLILFGTQLYLYINLLLGNDLIVSAGIDKENLFITHGNSDNVEFKIQASANPFCTSECVSKFSDISSGNVIETTNFNIRLPDPQYRDYTITAPKKGEGQMLYRFELECKSVGNSLCRTSKETKKRSVLLAVNYGLNPEEQTLKNNSESKISYWWSNISNMYSNILNFNSASDQLTNKLTEAQIFKVKISALITDIGNYNNSLVNLKKELENGDFTILNLELNDSESNFNELKTRYENLNLTIYSNFSLYNSIIDNLTSAKANLESLKNTNVTNETAIEIDKIIKDFNTFITSFNFLDSLTDKNIKMNSINLIVSNIFDILNNENNSSLANFMAKEDVDAVNITKIFLRYTNYSDSILLEGSEKQCCFFGKCEECCNESCKEDASKYPIVFLHGHDFNKAVSAESSLDDFSKMQAKLESNEYINAGSILIGNVNPEYKGMLGIPKYPVSVIASYYFDIYKNTKDSVIVQTKADSIDTYAIRFKDVIETAKYKTNRNKVTIVAHSMGGLVARRYIQLFGSDSISKLILIGTPNKGISGSTLKYCSLLGSKMECNEMNKDSLFINKLNNDFRLDIPVYNIVGIGCEMESETGDGIVTNSSAYLEGAENYFVEGRCNDGKFEFIHANLVDPEKFPEVYDIVNNSIRETDNNSKI